MLLDLLKSRREAILLVPKFRLGMPASQALLGGN
jgi:hypothetical protein